MHALTLRARTPARPGAAAAHAAPAHAIGALHAIDGVRVLLIGPNMLGLMRALLGSGRAAATVLRAGEHAEAASADLVLGHASTAEEADHILAQARRALVPLSRVIVRIDASAPTSLRVHVLHGLPRHGFVQLRSLAWETSVLIQGELPLFGRLAAYVKPLRAVVG